jgi:hypothetical protein
LHASFNHYRDKKVVSLLRFFRAPLHRDDFINTHDKYKNRA